MEIKGNNEAYYFKVELDGNLVMVRCGDIGFNSTSLVIDKQRFKDEMEKFLKTL